MDESGSAEIIDAHRKEMLGDGVKVFAGSYCESISYRFEVEAEGFRKDAFLRASKSPETRMVANVTCAPKYSGSDFHLHVSWRIRKKASVFVEFVKGTIEPAPDEFEPYAEEFFAWLEKFFVPNILDAKVCAVFDYPREVRESKFVLPLKASIGPEGSEVEIDGISLKLSPLMEGVSRIWITQEPENLWVHLYAVRKVDLRTSNHPVKDIDALSNVLDTVLEKKGNDSDSRIPRPV